MRLHAIDATIRLSLSVFIRLNPRAISGFLQLIYLLTPPRVVVIVLILSTLGWCPLNLIIGKISVFLSTDSQSTGFLTLNSHAPAFALLIPFIAVAVIKWNSSLQVSATWSVHFVGNESCNVHIKNYSIIWLGMGQTLAQGPPNPRWRQTNPQTR